ncbi:MAG: YceD family protein [Aestuariivita sp.]|nr:YceD family protein [Aestuariivita sp.]
MSSQSPNSFKVVELSQNRVTDFHLEPSRDVLDTLATDLGLTTLRKVCFKGKIQAHDQTDWKVKGCITAHVVQPCVATLEPVITWVETCVERRYVADFEHPTGAEIEMSEQDDTIEPIGEEINLCSIMFESLALAIPTYPRRTNIDLVNMTVTEPEREPLTDADMHPFAKLADMRNAMREKS